MKKLFYLLSVITLIACNISDDDKAKDLIASYLNEHANDPSSVEIVSVDKVEPDSIYSYIETEEHDKLVDDFNYALHEAEFNTETKDIKEAQKAIDKADSIKNIIDKAEAKFYPYQRGMKTTVKYRAKNGFGALMLYSAIVRFNKEISAITKFEDIETD